MFTAWKLYLLAASKLVNVKIVSSASDILIDSLTVTEKLALMDRLWADLSRRPVDVSSPDWHGDVLAERLAAVRDGKTTFVDWLDAKDRLRERLK